MAKKIDLVLKGATREERTAEIAAYYDAKFEGGWPRPFMATAPDKKRKSPPKKRAAAKVK